MTSGNDAPQPERAHDDIQIMDMPCRHCGGTDFICADTALHDQGSTMTACGHCTISSCDCQCHQGALRIPAAPPNGWPTDQQAQEKAAERALCASCGEWGTVLVCAQHVAAPPNEKDDEWAKALHALDGSLPCSDETCHCAEIWPNVKRVLALAYARSIPSEVDVQASVADLATASVDVKCLNQYMNGRLCELPAGHASRDCSDGTCDLGRGHKAMHTRPCRLHRPDLFRRDALKGGK